jgi:hypothetical protein
LSDITQKMRHVKSTVEAIKKVEDKLRLPNQLVGMAKPVQFDIGNQGGGRGKCKY